jgi:phosphatidylglycerol:prolipoprotein diacylglycerol transferase
LIHVPTHPALHLVFDALAWVSGALLARALYRWRLKGQVEAAARRVGPGYFIALGIGAVTGGYLAGSLVSMVGPAPTLSHSIAGVLAGAIVGVELYKLARGISGSTGAAFTGPLALGIAIGRWGCLYAGPADGTSGSPSSLPWAVELGDGVARHPVQVYESLSMLAFLAVYLVGLKQRRAWALERGFYVFVAWYGAQRFLWEFLKPYPRLLGGLDLFQLMALGMIAYGWLYFVRDSRRARATAVA